MYAILGVLLLLLLVSITNNRRPQLILSATNYAGLYVNCFKLKVGTTLLPVILSVAKFQGN